MPCRLYLLVLILLSFACSSPPIAENEKQLSNLKVEKDTSKPAARKLTVPDTSIKRSGNLPKMTRSELKKKEAARHECIQACINRRQAEAVSASMISQQCQRQCNQDHFIGQVEVVN